jgi:BMFP domain-containing protein YqiC
MTTTSSRFFDELAKLATNAAGAAQGVRREIDTLVKAQVERVLNDVGVVKREDFDVVREMVQKAREENDRLKERVAVLEARLGVAPAATGSRENESPGEAATH